MDNEAKFIRKTTVSGDLIINLSGDKEMITRLGKEFDIQDCLQNEETDFDAFYRTCIE